jgi:hypothetical protein
MITPTETQQASGVVTAIRRTLEYEMGHMDASVDSAVEIARLQQQLADTTALVEWYEMVIRIQQDDDSVPTRRERIADWWQRNRGEGICLMSAILIVTTVALVGGWFWLAGWLG